MNGVLHVRYAYKGFDVPLASLGVHTPTDENRLKQAGADQDAIGACRRHLAVQDEGLHLIGDLVAR